VGGRLGERSKPQQERTMWFVVIWIIFAFAVAVGASNRGRSGIGWFLLACVISPPLAGLLMVILGSPRPDPASEAAQLSIAQTQDDTADGAAYYPRSGKLIGDLRYSLHAVGTLQFQQELEKIAGSRQEGVHRRCVAHLLPEPDNAYDSHTVRVEIVGTPVGYLDPEAADEFLARLSETKYKSANCAALVVGGWHRPQADDGFFGLRLDTTLDFAFVPVQPLRDRIIAQVHANRWAIAGIALLVFLALAARLTSLTTPVASPDREALDKTALPVALTQASSTTATPERPKGGTVAEATTESVEKRAATSKTNNQGSTAGEASDADKAALIKVMNDAVAARHGGVLPKTMSKEDAEVAAQAAIKWKAKQAAEKTKRQMEAMKVKPPPSNGYGEIYLAKEAITKMMRDPDSAVFSDVFFVNDRKSETGYYVPVVCGTVNARNGFGGMTGPKHFVAAMSDLVQGLWLEGTTAQNVVAAEWSRFCAGQHD
jgi:hypothetical protein